MGKQNNNQDTDSVLKELDGIKRLLALLLIKAGTRQGEIAMALNVSQSIVSRMFPARKVEQFNLGVDELVTHLASAGVPSSQIAKIIGCDKNRVSRITKHVKATAPGSKQ